jgi:Skp family chaperone for outer membrane proteins
MAGTRLLGALLALSLPVFSQGLPDKFRDNRAAWEENLAKGNSAPVRLATEGLLAQDGAAVNPSDYNAMHALVAVRSLAARSCVMEGAWEDAIVHLQKASQAAGDNVTAADATFGRIRQQHQESLQTWHAEADKLQARLQDLDNQAGLSSAQIQARTQVRTQLEEYRNAISQSEHSLAEIDALTGQLRKEQETYAASLAEWEGFLAKEKADIARLGTPQAYVAEKLEQVKGDDAKPLPERLAYARRLARLDPANADCRHLVAALTGQREEAPPAPKAKTKKRKKSKAKPKPGTDDGK